MHPLCCVVELRFRAGDLVWSLCRSCNSALVFKFRLVYWRLLLRYIIILWLCDCLWNDIYQHAAAKTWATSKINIIMTTLIHWQTELKLFVTTVVLLLGDVIGLGINYCNRKEYDFIMLTSHYSCYLYYNVHIKIR